MPSTFKPPSPRSIRSMPRLFQFGESLYRLQFLNENADKLAQGIDAPEWKRLALRPSRSPHLITFFVTY